MAEVKPHKADLYCVAFWYGLADAIERALDEFGYRNDHPTQIIQTEPNTITVKWGSYVFVVDLLDGLYIGSDESSEFMYYRHAVIPHGDPDDESSQVQIEFAPVNADWYNIHVIDAMLDRAKAFAHIDLIAEHAEKTTAKYDGKDIDGKYVNMNGIKTIAQMFTNVFTYVVGIDPEIDKDNYSINVYPDQSNPHGIIIHTQLNEFDDKGFVNKDNSEFFLSIDLGTNDAKITPDLPWLMPNDFNAQLFTLMPRANDTDRVLLSAIRITVDDVLCRLHNKVPANAIFSSLNDMIPNKEFETSPVAVNKFHDTFENELALVANGNDCKFNGRNFKIIPRYDGITRVCIGIIVVDVAIDGLGLIDIGVMRPIKKNETWDNIIWNNIVDEDVTDNKAKNLSDIKGLMTYDDAKDDVQTESVLRTICNCVQTTLSRMYNR